MVMVVSNFANAQSAAHHADEGRAIQHDQRSQELEDKTERNQPLHDHGDTPVRNPVTRTINAAVVNSSVVAFFNRPIPSSRTSCG